ncbi:MAG: L-seryl-tRNA(Sec) selenium transferase [Dermabacter sp.]|nr:L-seryl-tRNA(Sec) selenium transferase [Dermabacter sp.]
MSEDPRRRIPRTDALLALDEVQRACRSLSEQVVRDLVRATQESARRGDIAPEQVTEHLLAALDTSRASSLTPVINATGVIIHTNLGRAPLSEAATRALVQAAGYVDVEFDLPTGVRSRRGAEARAALLAACPLAEDALVVNNGAAALVLCTTALARDRDVVLSRGELIEIGAGFRLTDLMESTGARIREVGTTNRTHTADYADAMGERTGAILKIHASNYVISGFTSSVGVSELAALARERDVPLIVDIGSGLIEPERALPDEPAIAEALAAGADLVIASGDKLLGGPQAGIIYGAARWVAAVARHPLARAVRADKLQLAALEATLNGPTPPAITALRADPAYLRSRTEALARALEPHPVRLVAHDGRVGGGGGAEVPLPGWALEVPEELAAPLRTQTRPIVTTVNGGVCLVDLRCVPESDDQAVLAGLRRAFDGAACA